MPTVKHSREDSEGASHGHGPMKQPRLGGSDDGTQARVDLHAQGYETLSRVERAKIRLMYQNNVTVPDICKELECSEAAAEAAIRNDGPDVDHVGQDPLFSPDFAARFGMQATHGVEVMEEEPLEYPEVADEEDYPDTLDKAAPPPTDRPIRAEVGHRIKQKGPAGQLNRHETAAIRILRSQGYKTSQIADFINCSNPAVERSLRNARGERTEEDGEWVQQDLLDKVDIFFKNRASAMQAPLFKARRAPNGTKKTKDEEAGSPPTAAKSAPPRPLSSSERSVSMESAGGGAESVSMHAPPQAYGQREVRISVPRQEAQPQPPPTTHVLMPTVTPGGASAPFRDFRLRLQQGPVPQGPPGHHPHPHGAFSVPEPMPMLVDDGTAHVNGTGAPEDMMTLFLRACNMPHLRPVLYDAGIRDGEQLRSLAVEPGLADDFFNSLREERRVDLFQVTVMRRRLKEWRDAR